MSTAQLFFSRSRRMTLSVVVAWTATACAEGAELDGQGGTSTTTSGSGATRASSSAPSSGAPTSSGTLAGVVSTTVSGSGSANVSGSGTTTGGPGDRLCQPGELLTSVDAQGTITCSPIAPVAATAVRASCSLYFGQRDSCGSCNLAPTKWGLARTGACQTSGAANDTCTTATLGGVAVNLFGLNTVGDLDDNDKLYYGLNCTAGGNGETPGPCPDGSFATAVSGTNVTCTEASGAILDRVRTGCHTYFGWIDECGACTSAPSRWGRSTSVACENGAGASNTCTAPALGGTAIQLFGLNVGGDVDDNDKLYAGLACDAATDEETTVMGECPAGTFVSGIFAGGSLRCTRPSELATAAFRDHCSIYYGWRDSCTGCTLPPAKWGKTSATACQVDGSIANTCQNLTLGGVTLPTLGLNPDGNVDENDKLYVGFHCE